MSALITPVLVVVWLLVVIAFWTGATHRWLQGRGLTRQVAMVIQAVVLSLSFTALWVSTDPALMRTDQLWLFWIWLFIVAYGGVLIWVRWIRPTSRRHSR
jgi:hypothetical protein